MGKAFNRAVEIAFAVQLSERAADFVPAKPDRIYGWPCGERAFVRKGRGRADWLSLCFSKDGRDEFTVDIGWSYLNRYPQLPARPTSKSPAELVQSQASEAFVRVRSISESQLDWWSATKSTNAESLVREAIECIEGFALPLLASLPDEKPNQTTTANDLHTD